jgi:hypothetical protein
MSKKFLLILTVVFVALVIGGYFYWQQIKAVNEQIQKEADQNAVKTVVENFGLALKNVSLLSPTVSEDIEKNYKNFISPVLLAQWKQDPVKAIGRLTSSPWPDRIEISEIKQFGSGAYDVSGKIIEATSDQNITGSQQVEIGVAKFENKWLITGISVSAFEPNELWKDYNAEGISFKYPEKLTTQYIFTQEWPPIIKVSSETYSCQETPQEVNSLAKITTQRIVDNRIYCVDVQNEGAAGSVYSSYIYTTLKNDKLIKASFVLIYPNCANYDNEQNQACASEREAFDIDGVVDRIVQSVRWDLSRNDNTLAGQLAECLPMSDTESKAKCDALISQINDFDSCVVAGFSIMKSNPPQCATPDGRTFTQK